MSLNHGSHVLFAMYQEKSNYFKTSSILKDGGKNDLYFKCAASRQFSKNATNTLY